MERKWKKLLEDLLESFIAIALWVAIAYGIVYFFPGATWVWYLVLIYAVLSLIADIADLILFTIIGKITGFKNKDDDSD